MKWESQILSQTLINPIPHEQNYFLFCMIGVFKDPKVLSLTYLQEGKSRDSTDHLKLLLLYWQVYDRKIFNQVPTIHCINQLG